MNSSQLVDIILAPKEEIDLAENLISLFDSSMGKKNINIISRPIKRKYFGLFKQKQ